MNSLLWFIPLAIYLLATFVGQVWAAVALIGLNKTRAAQQRQGARDCLPPVLSGTPQGAGASYRGWILFFKALLVLGIMASVLGLLGAWSARVSIAYERNPAPEWSDGRAPALEPLIRKHCAPFLTKGKTVGLAVAVVTPTNATLMTFGRAALCSSAQTRADTLFELGSITKTFTALTLERQIERGLVRLDQPIQELLPPGVELPEAARGITLRHLTTHTSGLPRMPAGWSPLRGFGATLFGTDPYVGYTTADLMADVRIVKLRSPPGTKSCYSNFGMCLLGYLLGTKAGSSYEALVQREVCAPLGLNDTTTAPSRAQAPRAAQGYRAVLRCGPLVLALRSAPWFKGNNLSGAGGLRSTAADMLKYLQANMHPEGLPLEHALRTSHQVLFKVDERTSYGMNWVHFQGQKSEQPVIWHNGGTGGFRSFLGFTADSRFGVLVLSNSLNTGRDPDFLALELLRDLAGRDRS